MFQQHRLLGPAEPQPGRVLGIMAAAACKRTDSQNTPIPLPPRQAEGVEVPPNALRQEPVGEDAQGNRYYYFSPNQEDCRLYREKPPPTHAGGTGLGWGREGVRPGRQGLGGAARCVEQSVWSRVRGLGPAAEVAGCMHAPAAAYLGAARLAPPARPLCRTALLGRFLLAGNHVSDSEAEDKGRDGEAPPPPGEPEWETVCSTLEELQRFVERLANSQNSYERSMHDFLSTSEWAVPAGLQLPCAVWLRCAGVPAAVRLLCACAHCAHASTPDPAYPAMMPQLLPHLLLFF